MEILGSIYVPKDIWIVIIKESLGSGVIQSTCKWFNLYKEIIPKLPDGKIPQHRILYFSRLLSDRIDRNLTIRICPGLGIWKIIEYTIFLSKLGNPLIVATRKDERKFIKKFPNYVVIGIHKLLEKFHILDDYKLIIFPFVTESGHLKTLLPKLEKLACKS